MTQRVVVAMSGGVDSSVAAALLVEQNYEVIGVMMRLWSEVGPAQASTNKCCTLEAVEDARRVADRLDIPFYLLNTEQPFKQRVVDFFVDGYRAGVTPNPCLQCNRHIRFGYLLNYARSLGADCLATGHYARVRRTDDGVFQLLAGVDRQKDQSYVLYTLTQDDLRHAMFPVGEYTKEQVRELARARGLPTASRHDSQDLCFLADNDYRRFLRDWAPDALRPGPIVDRGGAVLGKHTGLARYTIGQRKGLGIAAPEPLYVLELDAEANAVVVGTRSELGRSELVARGVSWTSGSPASAGARVGTRIRYRADDAASVVYPQNDNTVRVCFAEPQRDITPGQAAVFYDGDICLGGGVIA